MEVCWPEYFGADKVKLVTGSSFCGFTCFRLFWAAVKSLAHVKFLSIWLLDAMLYLALCILSLPFIHTVLLGLFAGGTYSINITSQVPQQLSRVIWEVNEETEWLVALWRLSVAVPSWIHPRTQKSPRKRTDYCPKHQPFLTPFYPRNVYMSLGI